LLPKEDAIVTIAELHAQNHRITELSNVFLYLIQDRPMCDTECARNVFFDYSNRVKEHIEIVDRDLCGKLISHPDQDVRNIAKRFLSGSSEIKRIFSEYLKDWCSGAGKDLAIRDHDAFIADTDQMFSLVLERIQRETEHLYPSVRKLEPAAAA
jgi:hypothetical protein